LYNRPTLAIDPGMHTNVIHDAAVDAEGRWAVTGSDDKTVRVWSLADGALLRTIRVPAGPGDVGKIYAVAMSPDGALIAAAGWTRGTDADSQEQIFLFDRASGVLQRRIVGLPTQVLRLTFSPDGNLLAALTGDKGLRIYARDQDWAELARDTHYDGVSYGAAFAPDGRLATTEFEGKVRLYAGPLIDDIHPTITATAPSGARPWDIAFTPDGTRVAIGHNAPAADLLDGHTLAPLARPDLSGIKGALPHVAWSADGGTLFAAGSYAMLATRWILAWDDAGAGARRALPAGSNAVSRLVSLPGGDLLVAAQDPWLGRLRSDGGARWAHGPPITEFRN
jgi:WD40 repeat protein